ncbi:MAG TPA: hypothetical protein VFA89_15170 [Terriglobales bacterium]|nr:hypothetical protein [Terriglobales bacterium]
MRSNRGVGVQWMDSDQKSIRSSGTNDHSIAVYPSMTLCRFTLLAFFFASPLLAAQSGSQSSSSISPPGIYSAIPDLRPAVGDEALSQDQIRELIRQVAEKDIENDKRQRNYTYVQREEEHKLDGKGQVKSVESHTSEVMIIYGDQVERRIAKNDKPLSEKDAAKEGEKIQKIIDKRKNESEADRKKRREKEEKDREEGREFVRDVSDAYNFQVVGIEPLDGRDAYVIDAEPRPGFVPHHKDAKVLSKFRFRMWIDKAESQWVKLDARCIDTVSWGLFIARIHKGSRILIDTTRVNDEVWLPKHVDVKIDARLALLKGFNEDIDVTYRDYKKFRTNTKIVGVGELPERK